MTEGEGNPYNIVVTYEWDDAEAAANIIKHGIDFSNAIGGLIDPNRLEDIDESMSYGE